MGSPPTPIDIATDNPDEPPAYSSQDEATAYTKIVTRTTTITTFIPNFKRNRAQSRKNGAESTLPRLSVAIPSSPLPGAQSLIHPSIDKALPATPDEGGRVEDFEQAPMTRTSVGPAPQNRMAMARSSSSSTVLLAQASLGAGVSPLVPTAHTPLLKATRDILASTSTNSSAAHVRIEDGVGPHVRNSSELTTRRSRSLSMGSRLTASPKFVKGKGKLSESDDLHSQSDLLAQDSQHAPQRRSSLWRLRVSSFNSLAKAANPPSVESDSLPHTLPNVRPTSPLLGDSIYTMTDMNKTPRQGIPTPTSLSSSPEPTSALFAGSEVVGSIQQSDCNESECRVASPVSSSAISLSDNPLEEVQHILMCSCRTQCIPEQPSPLCNLNNERRERSRSIGSLTTLTTAPSPIQSSRLEKRSTSDCIHSRSSSIVSAGRSRASSVNLYRSSSTGLRPRSTSLSCSILTDIPEPDSTVLVDEAESSHEIYLQRLLSSVRKSELASMLTSSADRLHTGALHSYMKRFDFTADPIDIALRKLLMELSLPKETQQIDRVVDAFASRYINCNPDLFLTKDHPYIIAFSLIMLHTDAFNKSNKTKMSKADYVKNTRMPGVASEVLEYLFDNIVFAPFIHIEDPLDVNGQQEFVVGAPGKTRTRKESSATSLMSLMVSSRKTDPYFLIKNHMLSPLRVAVDDTIPPFDPYLYEGTLGVWDEFELRRAFDRASHIEMGDSRAPPELPFAINGLSLGSPTGPGLGNQLGSVDSSNVENAITTHETFSLRVTKVGLLQRKDDMAEGGKRSGSRKWKMWSVILTGSQLLFFRDTSIGLELLMQQEATEQPTYIRPAALIRPDETISLKDSVSVYDITYTKHENVIRCVLDSGRQFLLRAENEFEINQWLQLTNYASAFRTAGLRMRTEMEQLRAPDSNRSQVQRARATSIGSQYREQDLLSASHDEEDQNAVTAGPGDPETVLRDRPRAAPMSPTSSTYSVTRSRQLIIEHKVQEIEGRLIATEMQLESDLRVSRNFAVLTPFQRSGRDRLRSAVLVLAKKVQSLRLDVTKLRCHRHVLLNDLTSMEDDTGAPKTWRLNKVIEAGESEPEDNQKEPNSLNSAPVQPPHNLKPFSITESFLTIADSLGSASSSQSTATPGLPASEACLATPNGRLDINEVYDGFPFQRNSRRQANGISVPQTAADTFQVCTPEPDEEAEDWNETKAGKRVSLVRLPSNIRLDQSWRGMGRTTHQSENGL